MRASRGGLLLAALFVGATLGFLLMPVPWVDQYTVAGQRTDEAPPDRVWLSRFGPRNRAALPRISAAELCAALGSAASPIVIDARSPERFAAGHVPGALHLAGDALREALPSLEAGRPIVVYDDWPGEYYAALAYAVVARTRTAVILDGGYGAWARTACEPD